MRHHPGQRPARYVIALAAIAGLLGTTWSNVAAVVPNTVAQWNAIAEDNVVKAGTFQNEGWNFGQSPRPRTSPFGPTAEPADDASRLDRTIARTGRDPRWQSPLA